MKKFVVAALLAVTLTACAQEADIDTNDGVQQIEEVKVTFLTPEKLEPNTDVKLEVEITQGGEIVDDADDVTFEVWQSGMRDDGEMLKGEDAGDGVFSANTTFEEEGVYYIFAHTNARGMHVMPKQQVTVGNPDMSTVLPDDADDSMEHMETEHSH